MADLKNDRRFANLNRLSTEQLEELLRTAPLLPDSQETSDYYDDSPARNRASDGTDSRCR